MMTAMAAREAARNPARPPMTAAHKEALAKGREEGRIVRRYLEAVDARRLPPGRPRSRQSLVRRLEAVDGQLAGAAPLARLHLLQERADLEAALARADRAHTDGDDGMAELEGRFVKVARAYSERKGIGYRAWRAAGVAAAVLEMAGITPERTPRGATRAGRPRRPHR
jgi:hypothetical protein